MSDAAVRGLHSLFPESLILAALDLIDRENGEYATMKKVSAPPTALPVVRCTTPWGYTQYEVLGLTATYSVDLDVVISPLPYYCTCPAFSYAVLKSDSYIMVSLPAVSTTCSNPRVQCKHVLASRIAQKTSRYIERPVTRDELALNLLRQYSDCDLLITV